MTDKIGCHPSWLDINTNSTTNKTCTREKLGKYLWNMAQVNYMGPKTIFMKYGCLKPCEFFEFKVDHSLNFNGRKIIDCYARWRESH